MNDEFLRLTLILIVVVILILLEILGYMYVKEKIKKKSEDEELNNVPNEIDEKNAQKSIFKFMEFDNVEDNMIVQDNGKRYLMIIQCKGVNYDLLSNVEKTSIEQGFLGFLNALKFEVQLYIQTRKVNLSQSTARYKESLKRIEMDMREEEARYQDMQRSGNYTREEMLKEIKEVTKKRNLYDYGKDIIDNTEQMSADSDLTTKEYYIVVPYYTDEITATGDFNKREISSMAFSELYTRAQSLVSALTECDVRGHIMTSYELIELLFIAYNREQHDIYDFDEYMEQSGFNSFYSVSEDVLEKRMKALDEEIIKKANDKAMNAFNFVTSKRREIKKQIEEREKNMQEYVDATAIDILESEKNTIGKYSAEEAKKEVLKMTEEEKKKKKKKEELKNKDSKQDEIENGTVTTKEEKKSSKNLTEEERRRRRAILKKRKLLKEKEALKNAKKEE